jgi:hypothetical protein
MQTLPIQPTSPQLKIKYSIMICYAVYSQRTNLAIMVHYSISYMIYIRKQVNTINRSILYMS